MHSLDAGHKATSFRAEVVSGAMPLAMPLKDQDDRSGINGE
jgi:hypothetical protein